MRFLIVQTGNKKITKRINVESITSIESQGNMITIHYNECWVKIHSEKADELADYIMNEIANTSQKVIDLRAGFVGPDEQKRVNINRFFF